MAVNAAVIVTAAGAGTRLGAAAPKALVELGGIALVTYAVAGAALAGVERIVVTAPPDFVTAMRRAVGPDALARAAARAWPDAGPVPAPDIVVLAGRDSRQGSVAAAVRALDGFAGRILVHDAARCLTPPRLFRRIIAAPGAVVPALPVTDTIKQVTAGDVVTRTVDRGELRAIQTPQGFPADVLRRAHAEGRDTAAATDDAGLVEAIGVRVHTVAGERAAMKITTPFDLAVAEAMLAANLVT